MIIESYHNDDTNFIKIMRIVLTKAVTRTEAEKLQGLSDQAEQWIHDGEVDSFLVNHEKIQKDLCVLKQVNWSIDASDDNNMYMIRILNTEFPDVEYQVQFGNQKIARSAIKNIHDGIDITEERAKKDFPEIFV